MKKSKLLNKLPISSQNPLLGSSQFFKYCKERFYHIGNSERDFKWLLNFYKKEKILLPTYSENDIDFYSSFQVYAIWLAKNF
ncbi:MAG: hypothetical protein KAI67_05375 [Candidatus Pacebacteria bacterium]|nr:hypothetical protein [Candidatus Paceibacterota bacterium]